MKYLCLILILFSCAIVKDGYNRDPEKLKEYILDAPGINKDQLFVAVNTYVTRNIKDRQENIEYQDKEAGKVIGYLYDRMKIGGQTQIRYKYEIDVKDEKLRCRFSYPELYHSPKHYGPGWVYLHAVSLVNELTLRWDEIPGQIIILAREESDW